MLSVLLRCRNEERWIGYSIQSLLDYIDGPEIIVIDNLSSDDSMDVVRQFEHHANIRYLSIDNYSPGRALNEGVGASSYDSILIFSAHCILTRFDSAKHIDQLSRYVAVFGKQTPVHKGRRITPRYVWSHFVEEPVINMFSSIEKRYFLHNAMCMYKRDMLLENKFDEKLYGKEDRYWAAGMIDKGEQILYDPDMWCMHQWTSEGATWKGIG